MAYIIISDGTHGRWAFFDNEGDALDAWAIEEQREKEWLKTLPKGYVFLPWNKSVLVKLGEVAQVKTARDKVKNDE